MATRRLIRGKYYSVRERDSSKGRKGTIIGLWSPEGAGRPQETPKKRVRKVKVKVHEKSEPQRMKTHKAKSIRHERRRTRSYDVEPTTFGDWLVNDRSKIDRIRIMR